MAIVEWRGGPITHRYLMNKTKSDLAHFYMDALTLHEKRLKMIQDIIDEALSRDDSDDYLDHYVNEIRSLLKEWREDE